MADVDINFVGPDYTAENPYQDRQVLVNWFCEIDPTDGAKVPQALLGAPGLVQVAIAS